MTYQQMIVQVFPWMTQQVGEIMLGCSLVLLVILLLIPVEDVNTGEV